MTSAIDLSSSSLFDISSTSLFTYSCSFVPSRTLPGDFSQNAPGYLIRHIQTPHSLNLLQIFLPNLSLLVTVIQNSLAQEVSYTRAWFDMFVFRKEDLPEDPKFPAELDKLGWGSPKLINKTPQTANEALGIATSSTTGTKLGSSRTRSRSSSSGSTEILAGTNCNARQWVVSTHSSTERTLKKKKF